MLTDPVWYSQKIIRSLILHSAYIKHARIAADISAVFSRPFSKKLSAIFGKTRLSGFVGSRGGYTRLYGRSRAWVVRARFYRGAIIRCPLILSHRNLVGECLPQTLLLRLTPPLFLSLPQQKYIWCDTWQRAEKCPLKGERENKNVQKSESITQRIVRGFSPQEARQICFLRALPLSEPWKLNIQASGTFPTLWAEPLSRFRECATTSDGRAIQLTR